MAGRRAAVENLMPISTQSGWAADNRRENPHVYPPGQELATAANQNKAIVTDLANSTDKGR